MRRILPALTIIALLGATYPLVRSAIAQVTPDQRKEIGDLRTELGKVAALIRDKKFDEAESILSQAEQQLRSIAAAAGIRRPTAARGTGPAHQTASRLAGAGHRPRGGTPPPASQLAGDVAHHQRRLPQLPRARTTPAWTAVDTFAGWKQGGRSGPLLAVGNANNSLLMARLRAPNQNQRMPQNANALPNNDIQTIATWINQGAKFDGDAEDTMLADLTAAADNDPTVVIPRPKGDETVSFTRDIAPFMANLCGGCHSRQQMNGGLCMETFYDMMKGGDSGRVVLPGNRDGSRLYRLVGGLENPRMPQGQARITRKNYDDLTKWFDEGCVYDGEDPKTPLRQFVRTEAEMEADRFAAMSAEEMNAFRIDRTETQFKRALPNDSFNTIKGDQFYLIGNVSPDRLRQVDEWSQAHAANLTKSFSGGDGPIWRGRLAIFVVKDRFSYDEFNLVVNRAQRPQGDDRSVRSSPRPPETPTSCCSTSAMKQPVSRRHPRQSDRSLLRRTSSGRASSAGLVDSRRRPRTGRQGAPRRPVSASAPIARQAKRGGAQSPGGRLRQRHVFPRHDRPGRLFAGRLHARPGGTGAVRPVRESAGVGPGRRRRSPHRLQLRSPFARQRLRPQSQLMSASAKEPRFLQETGVLPHVVRARPPHGIPPRVTPALEGAWEGAWEGRRAGRAIRLKRSYRSCRF